MKKKAVILISGLAVLLIGGVFGGQAWLKARLQKDALVAQMEDAWNCRAHLDDTSVSLFSSPATVKLIGLKLAPRDAEVEQPFAQRAAMLPDAAQLRANEVVLSVQLAHLLRGTVNIERLHIEGLDVRNIVDEEGNGSLDELFESPYEEEASGETAASTTGGGGSAAPAAVEEPSSTPDAPAKPKRIKRKKEPKPDHGPMKASELRVSLAVKEAGISNGRFEVLDLKGSTQTTIEHLDFALTDIDVVPGDLANHNHCKFKVGTSLRVEKTDTKLQMANFTLQGSGTVEPFDAKTGEWKPDTDLSVTLGKGGLIGGTPLEKQMSKKDLEKFTKLGIQFGDIAIGGVLVRDASTQIHAMPGGKLIVKQDTTLAFAQYEISVLEKSWFHAPQDQHNVGARLIISPELSARIVEDAKKALGSKVDAGVLGDFVVEAAAKALMDDQKRLVLPYRAKGKLSDPQPDFGKLLDDLLESGSKKFLEGLEGLFKK